MHIDSHFPSLTHLPQVLKVHGGFLSAYDSVRQQVSVDGWTCGRRVGWCDRPSGGSIHSQVVRLLDVLMEGDDGGAAPRSGPLPAAHWRVMVTGHSLGGALATLGAYELAMRQ